MSSLAATPGLTGEASPGLSCSDQSYPTTVWDKTAMSRLEARVLQDIREVLRSKEEQLEQLQKEIEALRLSLKILESGETPTKISAQSEETQLTVTPLRKPGATIKQFP
jgi:hypothetical protein